MRFFQQAFQPVGQLHAVARELILTPRHRSPQTLFRLGHKAQNQFLGYQPLDQALGIGKIFLPSLAPTIGLSLRQRQPSRHPACPFSSVAHWLPRPLQRSPHRLPVLRRRCHHHFLDPLLA